VLAATFQNVVDLVGAVAWPLTAIAIFLILRPYLPGLMKGISSRISKVSLASVSVEFVASEVRSEVWTSLSYLRDPMSTQSWADSSRTLNMLIKAGERADSAKIDLGTGDRWLTSRLYIFSAILSELLDLRCLVFLETRDGVPVRFVGVAHPDAVSRAVGRREPWLEDALAVARVNLSAPEVPAAFTELKTVLEKREKPVSELAAWELNSPLSRLAAAAHRPHLDPQAAETVAQLFRDSPSVSRVVDPSKSEEDGWVRLGESPDDPPKVREERASWIRSGAELERILGDSLSRPALVETPGITRRELQRQMVLRDGDYVALVDADGRFERLFDRRRLAEHFGREIAEQGTR